MSYILDALQKADAERERGQLPGLHTHTAATPAAPTRRIRPAHWALAALLVLLVAAAVGFGLGFDTVPGAQDATPTPTPSPTAKQAQDATPTPGTAAAPALPTPPALPAAPPAHTTTQAPLPLLAPPAPSQTRTSALPITNPITRPTPRPTPPEATPPEAAAPASPPTATAPTTTPPPPNPPAVRSLADLPPDTRAQLPPVNVSGSTYSQNPAHRMLIANGQVVQEGQNIAPGLVLETIGPRSAVLNHRGLRYSIPY
jgi:general secretion pathway protein B